MRKKVAYYNGNLVIPIALLNKGKHVLVKRTFKDAFKKTRHYLQEIPRLSLRDKAGRWVSV